MTEDEITISLIVRGAEININQIDVVWFRRGRLVLNRKINFPKDLNHTTYLFISNPLFNEELGTLERFIDECFYDKPHIGSNILVRFI